MTLGCNFNDFGVILGARLLIEQCSIFRCLDPMGHQNDPQGSPYTDFHSPTYSKWRHLNYQHPYEIVKIETLEQVKLLNRLFHDIWTTYTLKKNEYWPELSRVASFWSISYKCMLFDRNMCENDLTIAPKPSKIHPRSDPEPYQKIDVFLEGLPGALGTKS